MCSFGDIMEYDNKSTVKYPYVNIDVVKSSVNSFIQTYTLRFYVCDRNEPYVAYNKTETILNNIFKRNDIDSNNYTINYFSLDFKDKVNGVWADVVVQIPLNVNCSNSKNDI